ncbi:MAG: tetratricopeptide repeat protein [Acidobacteriota bacterium]|nr:tetratricopeptide repeat protein [Acidobacteriota bacterium]
MSFGATNSSNRFAAVSVLGVFFLLAPGRVGTQQTPFSEEERITAVDVLVELEAGAGDRDRSRELPEELDAEAFEVLLDGEPQRVVGLFDPRLGATVVATEPWCLVLYFDFTSSAPSSLRWAADILADTAADLTALGDVEIVVANPWPLRRLAPTRDAGLLAETLSGLALDPSGGQEILERRALFLEALPVSLDLPAGELAKGLAGEEAGVIGRQLDVLVTALAERGTAAPGRAVFLLHDGFDLEPERFYRSEFGIAAGEAVEAPDSLRAGVQSVAETLAGYGWTVVSLAAPEQGPGLVPGLRIGKWRFNSFVPPPGMGVGGTLTREHQREPETAESFFELGEAHLEAGEAEAAVEAFERALYHFAGDPRTAVRQAAVKEALGRAFLARGEPEEAREAFAHAVALDPSLVEQHPATRGAFVEPLAPLRMLTGETTGRVARDLDSLQEAVKSLGHRLRLTYQVAGWPQGLNLPVEVSLAETDLRLRLPRWSHSGTPDPVAAARARRVLAGDLPDGDFSLWIDFVQATAGEKETGLILEVDLASKPAGWRDDRPHFLRVTVAKGDLQERTVRHERLTVDIDTAEKLWTHSVEVTDLDDQDAIAVVVEDLESGLWGAGLIEPRS